MRALRPVLERERELLHARPARPQAAFEFGEQATQREGERLHRFRLGGQLQARSQARWRTVGCARIGERSHEAAERGGYPGTEAPRDAFGGKPQRVAQAQHPQVRDPREGLLRPVKEEKRQLAEPTLQFSRFETRAYRAPLRLGFREHARSERRRRDAEGGTMTQLAHAAAKGRGELRMSLEQPQAGSYLEHDAFRLEAYHGSELPGPRGGQAARGLRVRPPCRVL